MTREMMMRSNTMSMELAWEREQAYKAVQNERLQLQMLYDDDERQPPLQIEGPPSNLELVGMNQKASFENLSLSQVKTSEPTEGQMTNERITSNAMSVELAMQRELAYRDKIERLQLQPRYDAEEPPFQIEGPASNLKLVGMNQKENLPHSQVRTSEPILFQSEVACERLREETTIREVTDDRVMRNIMPVELAIQRELANQRKMDSVRFQPHNESKETTPVPLQGSMNRMQFQPHNQSQATPVFLQGAPSKPTDFGMKRTAPYGNPRYQPRKKVQSTQRQQGLGQLPVNLYCKFCHVFCTGAANYKLHCRGRKHKATLKQMNVQRNSGGAGAWAFWCDVCMVPCTDEDSFQRHVAGKKHALQATKNAGIV